MIQMIFYRIIFFFLFASVANKLVAQGGSIDISTNKKKILLGEPLTLLFEQRLPGGTAIPSFQLDSLQHFEILQPPVSDTSDDGETKIIKTSYTITSFDSGHWEIPYYILDPTTRKDSIGIDVIFTENFDSTQAYHDIKDIIEVKPKKKTPWWVYAAGGGLLLLIASLIYFQRKKKPVPVKAITPAPSLNAYEEAMKELDELQRSKPDPKTFYSKLTGIFRLYVYRKKEILSLQKTTDDLVLQLKSLSMDKDQFDKLAQALRLSDFVKFAKYVPSKDDDTTAFDTIKNSIINIEKPEAQVLPQEKI